MTVECPTIFPKARFHPAFRQSIESRKWRSRYPWSSTALPRFSARNTRLKADRRLRGSTCQGDCAGRGRTGPAGRRTGSASTPGSHRPRSRDIPRNAARRRISAKMQRSPTSGSRAAYASAPTPRPGSGQNTLGPPSSDPVCSVSCERRCHFSTWFLASICSSSREPCPQGGKTIHSRSRRCAWRRPSGSSAPCSVTGFGTAPPSKLRNQMESSERSTKPASLNLENLSNHT